MEVQSSYFSYLFALGIGQSLMLIFALAKSNLKKHISRVYFLVFLSIISLEILYGLLYQTHGIFEYPHLLRINTPFVLGIAPVIYLSIRHFLGNDNVFQKSELWHFLPFALSLLYFIPLYTSGVSFKLAYLETMFSAVHFDSMIFGGFRRIQQPIYILLTVSLIKKSGISWKALISNKFFRVLFALLCLFAFMWLLDVYRFFFKFDLYSGIFNTILMSSVLIYLTIKLISRESIFDLQLINKYSSSGLATEEEEELLSRISSLFEEEKAYTDQHLTLSVLASKLSVPANYISQSINNQLGFGYSDYINQWRVEEAKRMLENTENHKWTLLHIAQSSGFKSSSAFNSAFKKFVRITPSQFRKLES